MDIDPELNEQLRELSYSIQAVSSRANNFVQATSNLANVASKANAQAVSNNTQSQNNNKTGKTRFHQIMDENDQKDQKFKDSIEKSFGHSVDMLVNFGSALLSTQSGFQKYSSTLESLSKGSAELGSNFGILGKAAGGLLSLFGNFASQILKLNDNTISIKDNFAKAGGVIPETTERLGELAKEARFSLDNIKTLSDKMTELSSSMISLGETAGAGALRFMEIVNVDDEVRRQFGRLGVDQNHLLTLQGLYLESQRVSGARILNDNKSNEQIQRESLAYAKTLLMLSSVTGKSAEELQKEINSVRLEQEEQTQLLVEKRQIARLRQEGNHDEADRLERESKNREAMIKVYTSLYGRETALQLGRLYRTGVYDQYNSGLAMLNVEGGALNMMERIKEAESDDILRTLAREARGLDEAIGNQALTYEDSLQLDSELSKRLLIVGDSAQRINERSGPDPEERILAAIQAIEENEEEGADPQADRYENVRSFERESKAFLQTILEFVDPMRNFSTLATGIVVAAATALTGLAVIKVGGSLLGGLFDRGSSFMRPNHIVVSGMPGLGGTGGSAAFTGSAADPTGLGLRKADLVDKNGRPLGGAALDSRLRRIADERTPNTTTFALKQAARNSARILKGAATLAGSITIVGMGVTAATWMVGSAIPTFAKGMKQFNEVDGDNLKKVGMGLAGLGAGILALAAEKIVGFFNGIASVFGAKSPLERAIEKLQEFEKINVDADKIERNGKAASIFANVFKNMPATTVSFSGMLAGFFSGPPMPYDEFEKFSKFVVDEAIIENNSKAFIKFSNTMASYRGFGTIGGLGATVTALADSVVKYYEIDPPEKRFKDFSDLVIDPIQTGINAEAFSYFAQGMSKYRGPPGILSNISSLVGSKFNSIFGIDGPIDAFVKFSNNTEIGENAAKNTKAFLRFAMALNLLSGGYTTSGIISSGASMIGEAFSYVGNAISDALGGGGGSGSSQTGTVQPGSDSKSLDLIGRVESGGNYNRLVGGRIQTSPPLTSMTIREVIDFQRGMRARGHESTAVGKYQIIQGTLLGRVNNRVVSLTDKYDPSTQDKLAISLQNVRGRERFKQGRLPVERYADNLSKEWASLPYNTGRSYYDRVGTNKSLVSRPELINSLKAKEGGVFGGPTSGYPMELHGTELIVPVDTNSILMKLATEPEKGNDTSAINTSKAGVLNQPVLHVKTKHQIDPSRVENISTMFDKIIDVIDSTDDIDKKILQYN
jgi:muramidase (phage lysozyme)